MTLTWHDTEELARLLTAAYPEKEPLKVPPSDLRTMIAELPEFGDDPDAATDQILEDIQSAWYDASQE
jgi:FeS assembly protein IscX